MKLKGIVQLSVIFLLSLVVFWGCPKKSAVTASPEAGRESVQSEESMAAEEAAAQRAAEEAAAARAAEEARMAEEARARELAAPAGMQPVYFDFDQSFIRSNAAAVLRDNAAWLKAHPRAKVRIEGNSDSRGTAEYNQALGQRRAASAKKYLADLGIQPDRITLLSYGKEKPVCREETEACWQQNRRDDFIVIAE